MYVSETNKYTAPTMPYVGRTVDNTHTYASEKQQHRQVILTSETMSIHAA